jgi:2-polyprenyl-3-methyl-5-hydroxy-6-metoxy-1,4-benzoquinol methylase
MNKLNKKLIKKKQKIDILYNQKKNHTEEYKYLQDKIHLYFDSKYDTSDAENYVITSFWSQAYKNYIDGGYITNDKYISSVRFKYETFKLNKIIRAKCKNTRNALDIGCGNGRYTYNFAKTFDKVIGIDLSEKIINDNNRQNKNKNITYQNENFITMKKDSLGKFDFVFVGDIFMYTNHKDVKNVFKNLLKLLNKDGILIVRESTLKFGFEDYSSINYVAYYRNQDFYKKHTFKKNFIKSYRNYAYNLYDLDKYFNIYKKQKQKIKKDPNKLKKVVKTFVPDKLKNSYFYLYKGI